MDEEVLAEFSIEAEELLGEAEEVLLKIESTDSFDEDFNKIFRSFHSLKGAAGMFEIDELQSFMHTIEDQFESTKDQGSMDQHQVDYFLEAIDCARKILGGQSIEFDTQAFSGEASPKPSEPQENSQTAVEAKQEPSEEEKVPPSEPLAEKPSPIREQTQKNVETKKANELGSDKGIVYIVDDEDFICESLSEILKDHGHEVVSFTDPSKVLEKVKEQTPDLICTDLKMPQMSGLDLLNQMRENSYDFPIVFISGFIDNELLTEGLSCGASGFLEKPFEEHQVIGLVSNAIEKHKAWKLLNKSINYILYQFNDLDSFLESQGKNTIRQSLRTELQELLTLKKSLSQNKIRKK